MTLENLLKRVTGQRLILVYHGKSRHHQPVAGALREISRFLRALKCGGCIVGQVLEVGHVPFQRWGGRHLLDQIFEVAGDALNSAIARIKFVHPSGIVKFILNTHPDGNSFPFSQRPQLFWRSTRIGRNDINLRLLQFTLKLRGYFFQALENLFSQFG